MATENMNKYLELIRTGVPPLKAFQQAYPKGLKSREQLQRELNAKKEKSAQKAGLAKSAGQVAGLIGAKGISDYVSNTGWFAPEAAPTTTTTPGGTSPTADSSNPPGTMLSRTYDSLFGPSATAANPNAYQGGQTTASTYTPEGYSAMDVQNSSIDPSLNSNSTTTTNGTATGLSGAQAAQGALGAYQAYNGYNQYQDGDKVGGGLNMAGGATNVAAASGSSTAASAAPYLTAALGAYNMYGALQGEGSDEQRANEANKAMATAVADYYTLGGASLAKHAFGKQVKQIDNVVDPVVENKYYQMYQNPYLYAAAKLMGGKNQGQQMRDRVRGALKENGIVDENYNIELADGTKYDIGADGSIRNYEFDTAAKNDPMIGEHLKLVDPLAKILTGGNADVGGQFAGYFTNAIRASGDPLANAKALYEKAGITSWEQGREALRALTDQGKLTEEELAVYDQGLANIFGGVPLGAPRPKNGDTISLSGAQNIMGAPKPMTRPVYG